MRGVGESRLWSSPSGAGAALAWTSPKKVDAALRKNDPLLHLASRLIRDDDARRGIRSVYAWCRRADDVSDEVGVNKAQALASLDEIEADLEEALRGSPRNAIDAALLATFAAFPGLSERQGHTRVLPLSQVSTSECFSRSDRSQERRIHSSRDRRREMITEGIQTI